MTVKQLQITKQQYLQLKEKIGLFSSLAAGQFSGSRRVSYA